MRVLWLIAHPFESLGICSSGGWIPALAAQMQNQEDITIYFTWPKSVQEAQSPIKQHNCVPFSVPRHITFRDKPTTVVLKAFKDLVQDIQPDLIHVWGTEWYGPWLVANSIVDVPCLVSFQGIYNSVLQAMRARRKTWPALHFFGAQELRSLVFKPYSRKCAAQMEREAVAKLPYFDCATSFADAWARRWNPSAHLFCCPLAIRKAFSNNDWSIERIRRYSVLLPNAISPLKGCDIALMGLDTLMLEYPEMHIYVAGPVPRVNWKATAYERYIWSLCRKNRIRGHVEFLGPLSGEQLAMQMALSHCVVTGSLQEHLCTYMLEGMTVGSPLVVPFSGGMPDLFKHMETAIGYPVGDSICLAHGVRRIFANDDLASELSNNAKKYARRQFEPNVVSTKMHDIYRQIKAMHDDVSQEY